MCTETEPFEDILFHRGRRMRPKANNPYKPTRLDGVGGLEWAAPTAAAPGKHDFHAERQGGVENH